ncbi:MAG: hypothetical protein MHM6MM_001437 [Cercozoa sp. M6MM]
MDSEELCGWDKCWEDGNATWHDFEDADANITWSKPDGRIAKAYVPMCGASHSLETLAVADSAVYAVEYSTLGVDSVIKRFSDDGFVVKNESSNERAERVITLEKGGATLIVTQGDVLAQRVTDDQTIDYIYDRGALNAVPEQYRADYVAHLLRLLSPEGTLFLELIDMPEMPGRGGNTDTVHALFKGTGLQVRKQRKVTLDAGSMGTFTASQFVLARPDAAGNLSP